MTIRRQFMSCMSESIESISRNYNLRMSIPPIFMKNIPTFDIPSSAEKYILNPNFENAMLEELKEGELRGISIVEALSAAQAALESEQDPTKFIEMMRQLFLRNFHELMIKERHKYALGRLYGLGNKNEGQGYSMTIFLQKDGPKRLMESNAEERENSQEEMPPLITENMFRCSGNAGVSLTLGGWSHYRDNTNSRIGLPAEHPKRMALFHRDPPKNMHTGICVGLLPSKDVIRIETQDDGHMWQNPSYDWQGAILSKKTRNIIQYLLKHPEKIQFNQGLPNIQPAKQ